MDKGFIFTIDGIFAVIVALTFISSIGIIQQVEKGKEKMFGAVTEQAIDKAMIETYMATDTNDLLNPNAEYYYTVNLLKYRLDETIAGPGKQGNIMIVKKTGSS